MGELKTALEDALSGRGRLVMLAGEPGIGKTRTSQELATYAAMRGAQVLWGRCYEEQGMPPYWPWVQAIRSYVRDSDQKRLQAEMGAGAAGITEIVPDVGERLPELQPAPALEPEQGRFRLFDSITNFLKSAGQTQPLVLMLDDLHWGRQTIATSAGIPGQGTGRGTPPGCRHLPGYRAVTPASPGREFGRAEP